MNQMMAIKKGVEILTSIDFIISNFINNISLIYFQIHVQNIEDIHTICVLKYYM